MADKKKMVKDITSRDEDFAQWYTDIVKKAELADYSSVKGCMVVRPYGTAIWENIKDICDKMFKETGHENIMLPLFIPESLLEKEKDHVEGFAPEVAWVTHGGNEKLNERLCVRPTSETLFCEHFKSVIHSYRDLPKLYNQWSNVVRWEKNTRPFLRTSEFWWQEGHTMHETAEEAQHETLMILDLYAKLLEDYLAVPVIKGRKTEKEKFAGAEATYTIEAMMHDGKALQSGTSHYFGDGFAKAFDITFTGRDNKLAHPFQTSWGVSTRLIGAIIMCHGDDDGLILPPAIAPTQVVIVPIAQHKEGVLERANALYEELKGVCRVKLDDSDNAPGWKFAEHEMKGIPVRIELGPKDIEQGQCVAVTRNDRQKHIIPLDKIAEEIPALLKEVHDGLYATAKKNIEDHTYEAKNEEEIRDFSENKTGFLHTMWCGDLDCEMVMKDKYGLSSRCMPYEQKEISDVCPICGKKAKKMVIWGRAY